MDSHIAPSRHIDRRALIKRAGAAGAFAWTAPLILDSLTSPAAAFSGTPCSSVTCDTTKPSKACTWYAFRIVPGSTACVPIGGGGSVCADTAAALAALAAAGIVPKEECPPGFKVTSSVNDDVSFTLGPGCNLASGTAFGGSDCCPRGSGGGSGAGGCSWTFGKCNGHNLSHVDVIVCCCG